MKYNYAKIFLYIANFDDNDNDNDKIKHQGKRGEPVVIISGAAQSVELDGADFLKICTNIMHKVLLEIK